MGVKISIIIPVYNAEKTIERCLESVINQKYENLEIILVNDGSTDNSKEILEQYKGKDSRIKLINKENTGVSDTRNIGIEKATGDYIMFVDADDTVEKNMVERILNIIDEKQIDVLKYNYHIVKHKKGIIKNQENYDKYANKILSDSDMETFIDSLLEGNFNGYVWTLVIKKSIIQNVRFNTQIGMKEDLLFYIELLNNVKRFFFLNENLYNHYENDDSVCRSNKYYYKNFEDYAKVNNLLIETLKEQKKYTSKREDKITISTILGLESVFYKACRQHKVNMEELDNMLNNINANKIINSDVNLAEIKSQIKISIFLIRKKKKYVLIGFNKLRYILSTIRKK